MRKCLHSVCLAVCLSVSSDSWLSSNDNVHIYSLGEGKTIVPGDFPNSISGPDKDPADSNFWTHSERLFGFSGKVLGEERETQGLSDWLWVVFLRLQPPTMASLPSGSLQLSATNHFPPPSTETESAGATYGEKSPQQGGNSLEKRRSRRFWKKSKQTFILCKLVIKTSHSLQEAWRRFSYDSCQLAIDDVK